MRRTYTSFEDVLKNESSNLIQDVETVSHRDENIANNRMFVWNFEEEDLKELVNIFERYKRESPSSDSRYRLNSSLMNKMTRMMREGYNPVESMLYASKTINMRLLNDRDLRSVLAERVRDTYLKQEADTIRVLENIMDMWTWTAQLEVMITAVGLIGDNEELLDGITARYADNEELRLETFYALMLNKTSANFRRIMKIITGLRDTQTDTVIGAVFQKEMSCFGPESIELLQQYHQNPGVSSAGKKVIRKTLIKTTGITPTDNEEFYRRKLAHDSQNDEAAYDRFLEDCREKRDDQAVYQARFSRGDIGVFLKEMLEVEEYRSLLSQNSVDTAIISMGIVGSKGYPAAAAVIAPFEQQPEHKNAVLTARTIIGDKEAAEELVGIMTQKDAIALSGLYRALGNANISKLEAPKMLLQTTFNEKFRQLCAQESYEEMGHLASNLQIFWDKKIYALISRELIANIQEFLKEYAVNRVCAGDALVGNLIKTINYSWKNGSSSDVESIMFLLYNRAKSVAIQNLSYRILKDRRIEAPK